MKTLVACLVFSGLIVFVLCANDSMTTKGSYPILGEVCAYRNHKQKLRNSYFRLIDELAKDEYQWQRNLLDKAEFLINDKIIEMIRVCELESRTIGQDAGQLYSDWCKTFNGGLKTQAQGHYFNIAKSKYPHLALLGWRNTNSSISWNCAATLVHKSFVLTTAHCIFKYGKPPDVVRISEQTLIRRGNGKFAIDYDVEKVVTHESFEPSQLYNDIAILKIKPKGDLGDRAPPLPICIWPRDGYPTKDFKTLGYGSPSFGLSNILSLRDNYSSRVPKVDCSRFYNSNAMLPDGLRDSQLCGSDPKRVTGGCKDDSGGPLQFTDADELETPFLIGIASYGLQCRGANPGIYTRVYDFLDWIETKMSENML